MDNKKYFECDCCSVEHTFRISYSETEPDEIYFEPHLSDTKSLIARFFIAIGYIFGHKSAYGDFDSIILNVPKIQKLYECLGKFLEENKKYEEAQQENGDVGRDSSSSTD